MGNAFVEALEKRTEADWLKAVESLLRDIHDQNVERWHAGVTR